MKKYLTREEALLLMADVCSRSEQCEFDIYKKLSAKKISGADASVVINELKKRGFINNKRFARSFANDKVRFSGWGKYKIRLALISRRISSADIEAALEEIDTEDYRQAIVRAARQKAARLDLKLYDDRLKLYRFLLSRGFESSLASALVRKLSAQ